MKKARKPGRWWAPRIASVAGTPVHVHVSLAFVLGILMWIMSRNIGLSAAAERMVIVVLLLVCVVLHEVGHAVVARRHNVEIRSITLYPFGGLARLASRPWSSVSELKIAAAGPTVNLIAALGFFLAGTGLRLLAPESSVSGDVFFLANANLALGLCNAIPVFPLDGGRMLRAILSRRIGWSRATVWTASAGQIAGVVLIGVGILHYPWFALAGLVILFPANSELRKALTRRGFERQTVRDVMIESAPSVSLQGTTEDLTPLLRECSPLTVVTVQDSGRIVGYIQASDFRRLIAEPTHPLPLESLTTPVEVELTADLTLPAASQLLDSRQAEVAVVVDSDRRPLGIVLRRRLDRAMTLWRRLFGDDTGMDR